MGNDTSGRNGEHLTVDAICVLLAHHHRRELVRYLLEADEPVAVADAAAELAAATDGPEPEAADSDAVERATVALYHWHIPKLEAHNVVEYDRERDFLIHAECAGQLRPYLELTAGGEDRTSI